MTGMIEHLWQSTLVLGVLFLVALWMRNAPGRLLNLLWWAALAKLFLPWALLGRLSAQLVEWLSPGALERISPPESGPAGLAAFVAPMRLVVHGGESGTGVPGNWPALWLLLWLAGAACIVLVWTLRYDPTRDRVVPATNVGSRLQARLDSQLRMAGIPAERVTLVDGREMPKVSGWLRPRILLPLDLVKALEPLELRALLIHEDAHRRRRDPLLSSLGRLAVLCFYYYPLLWPLLRRLRATTEMACDERVLATGIPRETYARALARTIGLCLAAPAASPAAAGRSASLFGKRLQRIAFPWRFRAMTRHRIALTLGCLAVLAGSFLPGSPVTVSATSGESGMALPYEHPQRVELRKLAACDRIVRSDFSDAGTEEVLRALGLEMGVRIVLEGALPQEPLNDLTPGQALTEEIRKGLGLEADAEVTFHDRLPPGRHEYRLSGLTLEQALLEIARQTGLVYWVHDEQTLTAAVPLLAGIGAVTNPVLIRESKVEPVYPEEAQESGTEGVVILQAIILSDGTVGNIELLRASPEDEPWFAESAREAVSQWRYEPATKNGLAVPVYFTVFVEFKLN